MACVSLGRQYAEFALECSLAAATFRDRTALRDVITACVDSYRSVGAGESASVDIDGALGKFLGCCSCSRSGAAGEVGGQAVCEPGSVGEQCSESVVEGEGFAKSRGEGDFVSRGKHYWKNKKAKQKRVQEKLARLSAKRKGYDGTGCVSSESETGTVKTVDTRTGVEIEASQTLAARRVAENKRAEVEAKVAAALAEHRLRALGDKDRTAVVERLAAARYEQRINEARLRAQKSFSASEDSLKSLGSMGSAGELYAKQAIKKSRDDAKTLKYVQDQARLLLEYASPEVRQMVAEMPAPVYDDEFEVFGDCPSDFDEEQREAYYADLNRTNFELGQVRTVSEGHREATPEELLRIKEELVALSVY